MPRIDLRKTGIILLVCVLAVAGLAVGATVAFGRDSAPTNLPCKLGGTNCISIGFTEAWLGGETVDLEYSHAFFCAEPPASAAASHCEGGAPDQVDPPSGPIVSEIYSLIPVGFTPSTTTLHCPVAGRCIDHPRTIDLSSILGPSASNALFPAHANVIEETESFQSTWWPVALVTVNTPSAWNTIAAAKSIEAVDACEVAGDCTEYETNAYLFFQVLGPGMSPGGPD